MAVPIPPPPSYPHFNTYTLAYFAFLSPASSPALLKHPYFSGHLGHSTVQDALLGLDHLRRCSPHRLFDHLLLQSNSCHHPGQQGFFHAITCLEKRRLIFFC